METIVNDKQTHSDWATNFFGENGTGYVGVRRGVVSVKQFYQLLLLSWQCFVISNVAVSK